jgi:hypothetical protein
MRRLFLLFLLLATTSCSVATNATTAPTDPLHLWMSRTLYFSNPDGTDPNRNNVFQVQEVQTALNAIQKLTNLGTGYFTYNLTTEAALTPILTAQTVGVSTSFVLIWPDSVFNDFVLNQAGGSVPDYNAITVINDSNKREFYIIVRSSCFTGSASSCGNITVDGLSALVARQIGFLMGMGSVSCVTDPTNVMCVTPSDSQWSKTSQLLWAASFNNVLQQASSSPGFYDVSPAP